MKTTLEMIDSLIGFGKKRVGPQARLALSRHWDEDGQTLLHTAQLTYADGVGLYYARIGVTFGQNIQGQGPTLEKAVEDLYRNLTEYGLK